MPWLVDRVPRHVDFEREDDAAGAADEDGVAVRSRRPPRAGASPASVSRTSTPTSRIRSRAVLRAPEPLGDAMMFASAPRERRSPSRRMRLTRRAISMEARSPGSRSRERRGPAGGRHGVGALIPFLVDQGSVTAGASSRTSTRSPPAPSNVLGKWDIYWIEAQSRRVPLHARRAVERGSARAVPGARALHDRCARYDAAVQTEALVQQSAGLTATIDEQTPKGAAGPAS